MLRLGVKQTPGTSRIHSMSQNAITDELSFRDLSIVSLQDAVSELQNRQTVFVDYWTGIIPIGAPEESIWFDSISNELWIRIDAEWLELPLSEKSIYIKREDNTQYAWSGTAMVTLTVPLTKAGIEALLTGSIYSHDHNIRTGVLAGYVCDMSLYDEFVKLDCGANSQFTITNPILKKGFRMNLKGGTLQVPTFSGYTVTWILNSAVTDYVAGSTNYLWCEIRSAGQIYCFWGA